MDTISIQKEVDGETVNIERSLVGMVQAETGSLTSGIAGAVVAGQDASVTNGGGFAIVAGRDVPIENGGSWVLVAGRDVNVTNGGGLVVVAQNASARSGFVGVLLSRQAALDADTRVLMTTPQAAALGAGIGVGAVLASFILRLLFGRRSG